MLCTLPAIASVPCRCFKHDGVVTREKAMSEIPVGLSAHRQRRQEPPDRPRLAGDAAHAAFAGRPRPCRRDRIMTADTDTRRAPRRQVAELVPVTDMLAEAVVGRLGNISETGMLMLASAPMHDDALYQLQFAIPGRDQRDPG